MRLSIDVDNVRRVTPPVIGICTTRFPTPHPALRGQERLSVKQETLNV